MAMADKDVSAVGACMRMLVGWGENELMAMAGKQKDVSVLVQACMSPRGWWCEVRA